ncbi:MAG: hypothetical protein H7101_03215 [Deinococcales bacterium]|nr:hypothetical protein [Chitinophagaceae bacterium]
MTTTNSLGIFMDHASAHLMEFTADPIETTTINSAFTNIEKTDTLGKSEHTMHNTENHDQLAYNKKLSEVVRNYTDVLLFGPTDAKTELFNFLREDHRFDNIKIQVQPTDKLTENQQHAFVKHHFSHLY